ncbi:DNA mismatch repair protein Msh6 [Yamadazyma tenuis ATCC 10573]|uniref:DNA mismatch repair protein n=2 Tax=Candida tenuis TaxID=2315449 RepID=G3BAN3_CANTC|nr:DNA mismatch repair protein Msh6 [Yamadazyma tenuis ATCC 10573]EGV61451.1 DNA mismatch repair protein Msh6 [Yamadazyma tenuis ATCC 10573]
MKQQTLMAFFKPAKKPVINSSPVKKLDIDIQNENSDSDKENDSKFMEDVTTDTPLTSEMDITVSKSEKTPQSSPIKQKVERKQQPESDELQRSVAKKVNYLESEDEDDDIVPTKRRRVVESSEEEDDDEDDFKPHDSASDDDMSDFVVEEEDSEPEPEPEEGSDVEDIVEAPRKSSKPKIKAKVTTPQPKSAGKPSMSSDFAQKFKTGSTFVATTPPTTTVTTKSSLSSKKASSFAKENEERYQWLVNIRDAEKRSSEDPNYDPRSLYIPQAAWSKFTPFEKQYWEIKSKMWDTVVFFKKGKFYELYENDAVIANSKFDLKLAGGGRANMKLAGIPEMSFDYWAKEFISNGYKVARVDQKESLLAKEMRGGGSKEEKVIKRELTAVLTGGTLTDLNMITDDMATYCLSIKEEKVNDNDYKFGVVFVDTATSELNFIEIEDDKYCNKLETLITQVRPKEVICEKHNLSSLASKVLKYNNSNQIWNALDSLTEFWDYDLTLEKLVKSQYYPGEDLDDFSNFPELLVEFKDNHQLAFNAFGGLLFYLKTLKLDESIMTLKNFKKYDINKSSSSHLILDGITLNNLEILNNSHDGSDKGTLFKMINKAITPFGKRMLKTWVLNPLLNAEDINERFKSIEFLMGDGADFRQTLESGLTGLPDLERLLARIHGGSLRFKDFLKVIEGFERISKLVDNLREFTSREMGSLHKFVGEFPSDLHELIAEWEDSFDRIQALSDVISPTKGIDEEFDDSMDKINNLESQLNTYLQQYKRQYKSQEICFRDSGKEIFLIELPNKIKNIPKDWQTMGSTSKVKRYWSPEVKLLVRELLEQKELHKMVCDNLKSNMFKKFDTHYNTWCKAIGSLSKLDCLISLTRASELIGYPSCKPNFVNSSNGFIDFKELRNPVYQGTKEFIPNDVRLGGEEPKFCLLTGANAAGKSTIMRTTALAVILSQIGCFLPALEATLTPVDKIMTRLGANDNILQGKSTFFVELSETKKILNNATPKSLVILDELGRGGSSADGYAIAEAVLYQLCTHINTLGFFATHFGSLGLSFENHPQIKPMRMGIIAEQDSRNITFLYKLEHGAASGSFGMNVASMCGIANEIVENAEMAAKNYERTSNLKKMKEFNKLSLGLQSDYSWIMKDTDESPDDSLFKFDPEQVLVNIFKMIQ